MRDTLAAVEARLRDAAHRAGAPRVAVYPLAEPDTGFAMVTRLERYRPEDARPAEGPDRFPEGELRSGSLDRTLSSWLWSLVSATPGHYRVVVFVVKAGPVPFGPEAMSPDRAYALLLGPAWLEYGGRTVLTALQCVALIYELEKPNGVDPPRLVLPGVFDPERHLSAAGYWTAAALAR